MYLSYVLVISVLSKVRVAVDDVISVVFNLTNPPALPKDRLPLPSVINALSALGAVLGKVNVYDCAAECGGLFIFTP